MFSDPSAVLTNPITVTVGIVGRSNLFGQLSDLLLEALILLFEDLGTFTVVGITHWRSEASLSIDLLILSSYS